MRVVLKHLKSGLGLVLALQHQDGQYTVFRVNWVGNRIWSEPVIWGPVENWPEPVRKAFSADMEALRNPTGYKLTMRQFMEDVLLPNRGENDYPPIEITDEPVWKARIAGIYYDIDFWITEPRRK